MCKANAQPIIPTPQMQSEFLTRFVTGPADKGQLHFRVWGCPRHSQDSVNTAWGNGDTYTESPNKEALVSSLWAPRQQISSLAEPGVTPKLWGLGIEMEYGVLAPYVLLIPGD